MYLQYHYRHQTDNDTKHPFKAKTTFTPTLPDNTNLLEYMSRILHELTTSHELNNHKKAFRHTNNITNTEEQAIKALRNNEQLIVKPADKGGAIVIWPRESYVTEANNQLNNKRNYKQVDSDPFPQLVNTINKTVRAFFNDQLFDCTTFKFLLIDKPIRSPHYICFLKYTNLT